MEQGHPAGKRRNASHTHNSTPEDCLPCKRIQHNNILCRGIIARELLLGTVPLPQADKCCNEIVGVQPERCVKPLTEEHPHGCQRRCDTHHPHKVLLADFQQYVNHTSYKGEYLHQVHQRTSMSSTTNFNVAYGGMAPGAP